MKQWHIHTTILPSCVPDGVSAMLAVSIRREGDMCEQHWFLDPDSKRFGGWCMVRSVIGEHLHSSLLHCSPPPVVLGAAQRFARLYRITRETQKKGRP